MVDDLDDISEDQKAEHLFFVLRWHFGQSIYWLLQVYWSANLSNTLHSHTKKQQKGEKDIHDPV